MKNIILLKDYIDNLLSNISLLENKLSIIFKLLSQLTDSPVLDYYTCIRIIYGLPNNHYIFIYLHSETELNSSNNHIDLIPIGLITLIIEKKLIHGGKCVGHIEDLVVDKNFSGKGIARTLVNHCVNIAESNNCYKIILDCSESLEPFYNKLEFKKQGICMRKET